MAKLRCRFGHQFTTAAKPGGTTGCPECRRGGVRTSVRVPVARTAASASGGELGHQGDDNTARLAAAWAAEAPAVTDWRRSPTQPAPWQCEACGGPLLWHSARTAVVCLACPINDVSPAMTARAEEHAEAIARRRAPGAELAVTDPAAEARGRAARVDLHRNREALATYARRIITWCEAGYRRPQFQALAFTIGSTTRGYLPEINGAADNATLEAIAAELKTIGEGAELAELKAEHERQQQQEQADAERAERWAEAEAQRQAEEAEAERRAAVQQRAYAAELGRAEALAEVRERQQQATRQPPSAATSWLVTAALVAKTSQDWQDKRAAAAARLERNGKCGWCKRAAARRYGLGDDQGHWRPEYPSALACERHYDPADKWLAAQEAGPYSNPYYWDLDAA